MIEVRVDFHSSPSGAATPSVMRSGSVTPSTLMGCLPASRLPGPAKAGMASNRQKTARRIGSNVEVVDLERVLGDPIAPRLDLVAHQQRERVAGGDVVA